MRACIEQGWGRDILAVMIKSNTHERQGVGTNNFDRLRAFVVVDLKIGPFKPEYAGKINFYCNVVDNQYRHETDNPTIGLILCQDKNKVLAEYALRGMNKPIGISEYELTRALPEELKSSLPTIEEIEAELGMDGEK